MLNGLQSPSDTDELVITVDRVLRVLGNIALFITAFWRNVYLFKYPRLGSFFFSCLILLFLFGDAGTLFGLILSSLLLGMIYNVPYINYLTHLLLAEYLFKHIHTNFDPPQVLTKKELKFLKWSDVLKQIGKDYTLRIDGKIEKKE